MSERTPEVVLVRHGETDWSRAGRHTGLTDVTLTDHGRREARLVAAHLRGRRFDSVLCSPLSRAIETCQAAGLRDRAQIREDLAEWDYGQYEGRTTLDIRRDRPGWSVWSGGVPGGESIEALGARADRVIHDLREAGGDVALFSHGHFLRVLAARWIGLHPSQGGRLALGTAAVSVLGYERERPVILRWNQDVSGPGPVAPVVPRAEVPALTAKQMREVDRVMTEELGIALIQMMENAGRNLADLALRLFRPRSATVLAGPGGNGGGGLAAARHLANRGVAVSVALARAGTELGSVPARQLGALRRMGIEVGERPVGADLVLDALIGYSLRGDPAGRTADLITWANEQSSPVLALDTPSGLDVTTGTRAEPCVHAAATMTLALPKAGLFEAPEVVGRLFLADISVPPEAYRRVGIGVASPFEEDTVVELS